MPRLNGTPGPDNLVGTDDDDELFGFDGADTLVGGLGDDLLIGGGGTDLLQGDGGDDLYVINRATEIDILVADDGIDLVNSAISYTLGPFQEDLLLTGVGNRNGTGNDGDNTLTGNGFRNRLDGRGGNDTLNGNGGNDVLLGRDGDDVLDGGAGNDVLVGHEGDDTLIGGPGRDNLQGRDGDDLYLLTSAVEIAKNRLDPGFDSVVINRSYVLGPHQEGLRLQDTLPHLNRNGTGNASDNFVVADVGRNRLSGLGGDDFIDGGVGNDRLFGGPGNDFIVRGHGNDVIAGGPGMDTLLIEDLPEVGEMNFSLMNWSHSPIRITGIETVDTGGVITDHKIHISSAVLSAFSDTNTVRFLGDDVDVISSPEFWQTAGQVVIDAVTYDQYTLSGVTVQVGDPRAQLTASFDLENLTGKNGFLIDGVLSSARTGSSLGMGDTDGDGFADIVIGKPDRSAGGVLNGEVSLLHNGYRFGFRSDIPEKLNIYEGRDHVGFQGATNLERAGTAVGSGGDVNGDGLDEILIGAPLADFPGNADAGKAYVMFGRPESFSPAPFAPLENLSTLDGTIGFRIEGAGAGDKLGSAIGSAGDLNGDGFDEVIVGAPEAAVGEADNVGQVYVIFGNAGPHGAAFDVTTLDGTNGFRLDGIDDGDLIGTSVGTAGDFNGDGFDDALIGAPNADGAGQDDAGAVYVVFGKDSGFGSVVSSGALNGAMGLRIAGAEIGGTGVAALAGFSVASAGDVNGDGFNDIVVGARGADIGGVMDTGAAYVVFGSATPAEVIDLATLNGANGFRIDGENQGDHAGYAVGTAGDMNGDGYRDIVIGAPFSDPGGVNAAGKAYVVFGGPAFAASISLGMLDGSNGFVMNGIEAGDNAGYAVAGGGDTNGDGFDDVLVSAPFTGNESGDVYVVYGGVMNGAVTLMGTFDNDRLTGTSADDVIVGSLGRDRLDGRGGADVLRGGEDNDTLIYRPGVFRIDGDQGNDQLIVPGRNMFLNLESLPDGTIAGIDRINIRGSGNNDLHLNVNDVLDVSDDGILRILGNRGDSISSHDAWTRLPGRTVIGPDSYITYESGAATLLVDTDVNRSGIILV